jgi:hypothetical protein
VLEKEVAGRDARWSEAVAGGSLAYIEKVKSNLGISAVHRAVEQAGATSVLREQSEAYRGELDSESNAPRPKNTIFWDENAETTET